MATHDTAASPSPARPGATRRSTDVTAEANPEVAERHAEITEDVDDLLDEIDSVLEENAEEFVRGTCRRAASSTTADGKGCSPVYDICITRLRRWAACGTKVAAHGGRSRPEGNHVAAGFDPSGRLPDVFTNAGTSSFTQFLSQAAPELLPGRRPLPPGWPPTSLRTRTTIVAIATADGVVMAGDRRATMGNLIASRDIEKVHPADAYSLVGIAGTAGIGIELMRLFQVELEHYEKIEGAMLSLDGKANRLAAMVRGNLGAAMQGLAVVPLFAGFDLAPADPAKAGRIFSFDVAGGLYEETGYDAIGSGSLFAKSALKKKYRPGVSTPRTRSGWRSRRCTTPPTTTPPPAGRI